MPTNPHSEPSCVTTFQTPNVCRYYLYLDLGLITSSLTFTPFIIYGNSEGHRTCVIKKLMLIYRTFSLNGQIMVLHILTFSKSIVFVLYSMKVVLQYLFVCKLQLLHIPTRIVVFFFNNSYPLLLLTNLRNLCC